MWHEWMLDASSVDGGGLPIFCPREGDTIVTGMNVMTWRCPGKLVGLFHPDGQAAAEAWAAAHPGWDKEYAQECG